MLEGAAGDCVTQVIQIVEQNGARSAHLDRQGRIQQIR